MKDTMDAPAEVPRTYLGIWTRIRQIERERRTLDEWRAAAFAALGSAV